MSSLDDTGHDQQENQVASARRGAQTLIAKKGPETWQVLPVYVRAGYAYSQYEGERRHRERGEALAQFASNYACDLGESSETLLRVLVTPRSANESISGEDLVIAREAASKVSRVSDHLMRVLSGQSHEPTSRTKPDFVDPTKPLARVFTLADSTANRLGYHVKVELAPGSSEAVFLFEKEFRDAIATLAYMAVYAASRTRSEGEGKVVISSSRDAGYFVVTVEDNGHVFDRTRRDEFSGENAIAEARRVVEELHGGSLSIIPNTKEGVTASVRIPLVYPETSPQG